MVDLRYAMALFVTLLLPAILAFWAVMHGGIALWRQKGLVWAYSAASVAMLAAIGWAWAFRTLLIGDDLGTHWLTIASGAVIYLATIIGSRPIRQHLDLRTFAGVPEVRQEAVALIVEGPYAIVRHPRYLMVVLGIAGWCLVCNHLGTYLLGVGASLGFYLIAMLEERELDARFGKAYADYRARVPRMFPTPSGLAQFWKGPAS